MKDEIIAYLNKLNCKQSLYKRYMKRDKPEMVKYIEDKTSFLPNDVLFLERLYCVLNDIDERPKCLTCKTNDVSFDSVAFKYRTFCSASCGQLNLEVQNKRKEACLKKYGVDHPMKSKEILDKMENTCKEKYGSWYLGSNDCIEKTKKTMLEKYGSEHYADTEEFKQKSKETCLKKYGVEFSFQSENNKEKTKETILKKYGVEKIGLAKEIRNKIRKTNIEKFGTDMPLKSKEIYQKTMKKVHLNSYEFFLKDENVIPLFSFDEYDSNISKLFKWKCRKCGNEFFAYAYGNECEKCNPKLHGVSNMENDLFNFVKEIDSKDFVKHGDKKQIYPFQIDIYLENRKIGFEFNGMFWHSELNGKTQNYHLDKLLLAEKNGIELFHIFEDYWEYKKDIVKSKIEHILQKSKQKIYARKCIVSEVSSNAANKFYKENSFKIKSKGKLHFALKYNNEIVSCMSFSRNDSNFILEDFVVKKFCHIPGAFSRLLKKVEIYNPKTITSIVDRTIFKKDTFLKNGFTLLETTEPKCFLVNAKTRKRLSIETTPKTEKTFKIWDCGNLVFVKTYS